MNSGYKRYTILMALCALAFGLFALVPPHPKYHQIPANYTATRIELPDFAIGQKGMPRPRQIPNNILVLRVQFPDVHFQAAGGYPDFLMHDEAFFDRWMLHLSDFFADASHNQYELNYTLPPQVFTLPQAMGYYGGDTSEAIDARIAELARDLVDMADPIIDFSQYGGLIIFHAGSGQESDISGIRRDQIWSTFLTRKNLQAAFDPENNNYPGLATSDGAILTNIVIIPESEFQDYFPTQGQQDAEAYLFSIYGVLAHQFGHLIGLPTLFDNDSSNGRSQGIGNWGLMGTGVWNASGYVPAQVSGWCRDFLGWEDTITIVEDRENITIDHFLDHESGKNRLYKIPISEDEYFLIENRRQNPDDSINPYNGMPSYTFKLLAAGVQDYYDNYPLLPYFNFMENRYIGSEWDFFLPGLGGPLPSGMNQPVDGSGLLIWHIDENVIRETFTLNFDKNRINGNALHKGIDLEEADGIQHLDTSAYDIYKWGSPYDTFRQGNNAYFGNQTHNGLLSLPTAVSYYGGIPLEIYDISSAGNQMSFSVSFGWKLDANFSGANPINACMVDFDGDGSAEIFYPMPDGSLNIWKDETMMSGFPLQRLPVAKHYVWDATHFYIPMQEQNMVRVYRLGNDSGQYVFTQTGWGWASHPVDSGSQLFIPLNNALSGNGALYRYNKSTGTSSVIANFNQPIATNMILFREQLYLLTKPVSGPGTLWRYDTAEQSLILPGAILDVPADSTIVGIYMAPIVPPSTNGELILQTPNSIYLYDMNLNLLPGFPFVHDMNVSAPLSLSDIDKNGSLDILLGGENGIIVLDYSGSLFSPAQLNRPSSVDTAINGGLVAFDLDGDGKMEMAGSFINNRLMVWEDNFKPKNGFPVSFSDRSRNLPMIGKASDNVIYLWSASDNGKIFRQPLPQARMEDIDPGWIVEYGNLSRRASRDHGSLPNQYQTDKTFVPGELYVFPNPLKPLYGDKLSLNLMTNRDAEVEIEIYDVSGALVYRQKAFARAYLRNREIIDIPEAKLGNGVYIVVVSANKQSIRTKFAVQK
ncbi:MAG: M6 family metalloprotease domain-containing protein [Candidatus Cloacimonadaceae bacterium]|nr:M6 family metalloprotease domain-containing protein [Candidatus Cloacimonadaceae bacterium]MDP3115345.1 M6 family metalloprotease domain-containing protein [Candidatus Cloacimonadaceae bacterium]